MISKTIANPIGRNLVSVYQRIDLPSKEELLSVGKSLAKENFKTKKGKALTIRNKHKNSYWKDVDKRGFVEDDIQLFEFLTSRGFMIPVIGDDKSGGRVVDSFTLMPSWIRNEVMIDGQKLAEADFSALHPNIAATSYGGNYHNATHQEVAEKANIDPKIVKLEHLSFFNKDWNGMMRSPLFDYYSRNEPAMMEKIYRDKFENGYKATSMKLFKTEVEIMSDAIEKLNDEGIEVLYVYDALMCLPKDSIRVVTVMNKCAAKHNVKTTAKLSNATKEILVNEDVVIIEEISTVIDNSKALDFNFQNMLKLIEQDSLVNSTVQRKFKDTVPTEDYLVGLHQHIITNEALRMKYIAINSYNL